MNWLDFLALTLEGYDSWDQTSFGDAIDRYARPGSEHEEAWWRARVAAVEWFA